MDVQQPGLHLRHDKLFFKNDFTKCLHVKRTKKLYMFNDVFSIMLHIVRENVFDGLT